MPHIINQQIKFVNSPGPLAKISAKKAPKTNKPEDLRIVFMGTPQFAIPILDDLIKSEFKPMAVVTAPDKPTGRNQEIIPPPVKVLVQNYQIPAWQPETKEELVAQTTSLKPDLIIISAYGKILPKEVLMLPKYGSINVHPSLLPKYRGPSPIQFAILNGDKETGASIMLMNEKIDEGPILAQQSVAIEKKENYQSLEQKLSALGAKLLLKTLKRWVIIKELDKLTKKLIYPQEQDHLRATYTKVLTRQDGKIIWNKTAEELERQIRAFYPWPGSFTFVRKDKKLLSLKIIRANALKCETEREPGEVFLTDDKKLAAQTGKNCLLIEELQLEGSQPLPASEFLKGRPEIIGTILQ